MTGYSQWPEGACVSAWAPTYREISRIDPNRGSRGGYEGVTTVIGAVPA